MSNRKSIEANNNFSRKQSSFSVIKISNAMVSVSKALFDGGIEGPTGKVFVANIGDAIRYLREAEGLLLEAKISAQQTLEESKGVQSIYSMEPSEADNYESGDWNAK